MGIPAHDLTTGLVSLSSKDAVKVEPVVEAVTEEKPSPTQIRGEALTEAQKAELAVKLLAAIEAAVHDALKKA
jgi:hypothetical protein